MAAKADTFVHIPLHCCLSCVASASSCAERRILLASTCIWLIQVFRGAFCATFQPSGRCRSSSLLGRRPVSILCTCPNRRSCACLTFCSTEGCWQHTRLMSSFRQQSRREIPSIARRHLIWNASNFRRSPASSVHVSVRTMNALTSLTKATRPPH